MNLIPSMISRHYTSLWFPNTRIEVNYSHPKYNQVAMLRYIGMCVHIASRHRENSVIFIISFYPGPKQRKKQNNPLKLNTIIKECSSNLRVRRIGRYVPEM